MAWRHNGAIIRRDAFSIRDALSSGQLKREFRDHRLEWLIKFGGLEVVLKGLRYDNIRFTEFG